MPKSKVDKKKDPLHEGETMVRFWIPDEEAAFWDKAQEDDRFDQGLAGWARWVVRQYITEKQKNGFKPVYFVKLNPPTKPVAQEFDSVNQKEKD